MTDRQLYAQRRCYICLKVLPDGHAINDYCWAFFCIDTCYPRADELRRVFDRSPKGRWRNRTEWKRMLRQLRPVQP